MPKGRYTFRTTRKTQWLDEHLSTIPKQDLSDYLREMVIRGIQNGIAKTMDVAKDTRVLANNFVSNVNTEITLTELPPESLDVEEKLSRMSEMYE